MLTRWIEQLEAGVFALLASQRWKIGSAVSEAGRRALMRSRVPTAEDNLRGIFGKFRAWRQRRSAESKNGNPEQRTRNAE